jgi:hypothetical protein
MYVGVCVCFYGNGCSTSGKYAFKIHHMLLSAGTYERESISEC